jgi:phage terminase large subunit-like protein
MLAEDGMLIFDQSIMQFCMGNAVTIEDTNGNRKLCKMRRDQKIDNVSALMDAYIAFKEHKELFGFEAYDLHTLTQNA